MFLPPAVTVSGVAQWEFETELWLYEADAAWHFITVPADVSDEIEGQTRELRRGFGSVRVSVTVGETTWATSVFPDRKRGAYLLPVKAEVRRREGLSPGSVVHVGLELVDV